MIVLAVLAALAAFEPAAAAPWLDAARYAAAAVLARPYRALSDMTRKAGQDVPGPAARAAAERWRQWQEARAGRRDASNAYVLGPGGSGDTLIVSRGRSSSVERGCAVSAAGALIGFVDRTEEQLARVRLLSDPHCPFAGQIMRVLPDSPVAEVAAKVLLRGFGRGWAEAQQGSLLRAELAGLEVYTIADAAVPAGLRIGRVEASERLGGLAVALDPHLDAAAEVTIHAHADGAPLAAAAPELFRAHAVRLLCAGDSRPAATSWMVDGGTAEGVEPGLYVSRAGCLVARVARSGRHAARLELASVARRLPRIALRLGAPGEIASSIVAAGESAPADAIVYAAGRSGAPRALCAGTPDADALELFPGDSLTVHVFVPRDELRALAPRELP
jgi:hypothetical protein